MLATSATTTWTCECGFRNRDSNSVCGGAGKLGCKKPRPREGGLAEDLSAQLAEFVLQAEEEPHSHDPPSRAAASQAAELPPDDLELALLSRLQKEMFQQVPETAQAASPLEWLRPPTEEKPAATLIAPEQQTPHSQSGKEMPEWTCVCGFRNRGSNASCGGTGRLGCGLPRPDGRPRTRTDESQTSEAQAAGSSASEGYGAPKQLLPPGVWVCACGFRNRTTNKRCGGDGEKGCGAPRPETQVQAASLGKEELEKAFASGALVIDRPGRERQSDTFGTKDPKELFLLELGSAAVPLLSLIQGQATRQ